MDKIPLSDNDVAPLEQVSQGVVALRILMVNVFAITGSGNDWFLVDAGLPHSATRIESWAQVHFGANHPPKSILLTHGHFDHVGAAKDLAEKWDVPVYSHTRELPFVTGKSEYPPADPKAGGGLMALLSPLYSRGPIDLGARVRAFAEDGSVPGLPDWRCIPTPGHTVGHVSFFRESDRTLIAGDAFCTTKAESVLAIATQSPELHGPPTYFTSDWDAAKRSVEMLAALRPLVLAAGHGRPMAGPHAADAVQELAANFDRIARPDNERRAA